MSRKEFPISFFELLQSVQEGNCTAQQQLELEQILLSDPEARQTYYDTLDVDQGLAEITTNFRPSPPAITPPAKASITWNRFARYGAVAAAFLIAGVVLEWWLQGGLKGNRPLHQRWIAVSDTIPHFIATLVRSTDCDWEDEKSPFFEGQRLLSSELQLNRGVAEFRLDTGIRLILEGPTRLKINSARSAVLESGKVVLYGHEMADGFVLVTPQATLTDIGTEYGTTVDDQANVEVHVFQGSVKVEPVSTAEPSDLLEAGIARRFSKNAVEDIPLQPELFQREVPGQVEHSSISPDGLMAFEGFRSSSEDLSDSVWQSGGMGWKGNWSWGPEKDSPLSKGEVDSALKLQFREITGIPSEGALRLAPQCNLAWRALQHPVRMNTDGIYYISFFIKKLRNAPPGTTQYGSLTLRTGNIPRDSYRIGFGMSSERLPIMLHNEQQLQSAPPLQVDQPYFYVAKIVAGKNTPDQVQMRVFSKDELIPDREPYVWTCISSPAYDDTVYDHMMLYIEGAEYAFDEIRVASSWQAATNFNWPTAEKIREVQEK